MKQLILVRHGKAEHQNYSVDFNRNLTSRGVSDAHTIGENLKEKITGKTAFLSSPANRAIQTAKIFAGELSFPEKQIEENEQLYNWITTTEFIDIISNTPDNTENLLVFGHNPTKMALAERFAPDFNGHMPTSCAVGILFDVEKWRDIEADSGKLNFHYYPKKMRK
jgi:phosphohistidine phosphatase